MGARRFTSLAAVWLCVVAGCVLFWSVSAQALTVHVLAGSFGSEGSGAGQFREPLGVAVNDTSHDVYVVDRANDRVEEFNSTGSTLLSEFDGSGSPTGVFADPTDIAVDNSDNPLDPSAGDVYVVDSGHNVVDKFSASGTYEGQLTGTPSGPFSGIVGVAVDPSGSVWVALTNESIVDSFSDTSVNRYLSERKLLHDVGPEALRGAVGSDPSRGFAVNSEGDVYRAVSDNGLGIAEFNSSGEQLVERIDPGSNYQLGIAVDSKGKQVYITDNETTGVTNHTIGVFGLSGAPIERFGSGQIVANSGGIAVDESNSTVYVTDQDAGDVLVFNALELPSVSIGPASDSQPRSVTLNGTVDPEGLPVTSCVFEYGTTSAYGHSVPCSPNPGSGASPVAVSAELTGLVPETKYHYRLVAENEAHVASPTSDHELTAGPVLGSEYVTNVASSSATLQAQIDPNGDDTRYYFQYGTTTAYGSYAPTSPPGLDIESTTGQQTVSLHLQDLASSTTYHFRLVVVQGGESFEEPDHTFATQPAGGGLTLPDGREWELVSPPNKKGALIEPFETDTQIQAASNGDGIAYVSAGPAVGEGPQGKISWSQVLSMRAAPGGWISADLTLPAHYTTSEGAALAALVKPEYALFSQDLSLAAVVPQEHGTPLLSPEATERTLYLRNDVNKSFVPLANAGNVSTEVKFGGNGESETQMEFADATPDLSHIVFTSPYALTPEATSGPEKAEDWNLYEWSGGQLQLVNILEDGEATDNEVERGDALVARLAGASHAEGYVEGSVQRAISNDGRRIAWTIGVPYKDEEYGGLFVRDMVEERTVRVGGAHAFFQTMSSDGSRIFFLEDGDLYEYDFETGTQTDLTADHGAGEASGGVRELVSDVSEDGSYVYFVASSVLGDAAGAVSGADNLYLLHDVSSGWSTTYITTLSSEDEKNWYQPGYRGTELSGVTSRVSPDGRYLAFMSDRSLTGYDNADAFSGHADEEVYLYDAVTGRLACASCDPTGARPVGVLDENGRRPLVDRSGIWAETESGSDHWLAGSIPGWDNPGGAPSDYQPRYLSDSGRLFFDSPDALVPQATNGLEDVYEYEPEGTGDCNSVASTFSERSGGCVGLISSGTSSEESVFYDASENGDDAFFITASKLVGADYDNGYDVYDAHVCATGAPCVSAPVAPPSCSSGDSCKAAPSPQPELFGPTPSATFSGTGNVLEEAKGTAKSKTKAKTKKGKVKKKGKKAKASKGVRSRKGRTSRKGKG